jgi:hypothetical protein
MHCTIKDNEKYHSVDVLFKNMTLGEAIALRNALNSYNSIVGMDVRHSFNNGIERLAASRTKENLQSP